jgi:hypothetical protein
MRILITPIACVLANVTGWILTALGVFIYPVIFIRKVVKLTQLGIDDDIEQLYEMVSEALSKIDDGAEIFYKENKDLRVRVKFLEARVKYLELRAQELLH